MEAERPVEVEVEVEDDWGVEVEMVFEGRGEIGDGRRVGMATVWCGKNPAVCRRQWVDGERQEGEGLARWRGHQ